MSDIISCINHDGNHQGIDMVADEHCGKVAAFQLPDVLVGSFPGHFVIILENGQADFPTVLGQSCMSGGSTLRMVGSFINTGKILRVIFFKGCDNIRVIACGLFKVFVHGT